MSKNYNWPMRNEAIFYRGMLLSLLHVGSNCIGMRSFAEIKNSYQTSSLNGHKNWVESPPIVNLTSGPLNFVGPLIVLKN